MKTLLIETVSNGWLVRPFQPSADWVCTERPAIAVYTRLEDLQADLPKLLEFDGYMNANRETPKLAPPKEKIQNYDTLPTHSIL